MTGSFDFHLRNLFFIRAMQPTSEASAQVTAIILLNKGLDRSRQQLYLSILWRQRFWGAHACQRVGKNSFWFSWRRCVSAMNSEWIISPKSTYPHIMNNYKKGNGRLVFRVIPTLGKFNIPTQFQTYRVSPGIIFRHSIRHLFLA